MVPDSLPPEGVRPGGGGCSLDEDFDASSRYQTGFIRLAGRPRDVRMHTCPHFAVAAVSILSIHK
jgi:hypothetical protein